MPRTPKNRLKINCPGITASVGEVLLNGKSLRPETVESQNPAPGDPGPVGCFGQSQIGSGSVRNRFIRSKPQIAGHSSG